MKAIAIKDLKGLKAVKAELEARAQRAKELEAAKKAAEAKAKAEEDFFALAVGIVRPLPPKHRPGHRASLPRVATAPIAVQHQLDELAVMQEALSDEFDVETLLDTDDALRDRKSVV